MNLERVPAVDPTVPSSARVYDYLLGGKDNYPVDRNVAEKLLSVAPDTRGVARANRRFLGQAIQYMVKDAGIRQFIDLGTGIPTSPSVHEVARGIDPSARAVYVDNDPIVMTYNNALLVNDDGIISVQEDIRRPAAILDHPDVQALIDFDEPIGVLFVAVLHFISDAEDPGGIIAQFRERMAPGSHLVLSHMTTDSDPQAMAQLLAATANTPAQGTFRAQPEILRLFDGFDLIEPGLVPLQKWRPRMDAPTTRLQIAAGVGRKSG